MSDAYARALARTAAAQTAEASGFQSVRESAADALAELVVRYLKEVGASSQAYAEMAGRTHASFPDAVRALEDTGVDLDLLCEYVEKEDEIPFARTVPSFPVRKKAKRLPTFVELGEEPPSNVPAFLPAFPDKHTYKSTPAYDAHDTDPKVQKDHVDRQRREAKRSLASFKRKTDPSLPLRLLAEERHRWGDMHANKGSMPLKARQAAAEADAAARNPFLAPPEVAPNSQGKQEETTTNSPRDAFARSLEEVQEHGQEKTLTGVAWEDKTAEPTGNKLDRPPLTFSLDWASRTRAVAAASSLGADVAPVSVFPSARAATYEAEQDRMRKQRRAQEILRRGAEQAILQEEEEKQ